ncbi:MAG: hypothetical protein KF723_02710 [Rhizobiaceae bacterium]|nr:hypothetical protein [Rhizobiaceae bacterium]
MTWFPSADRIAPIAISMMVDRPGTIGPHPFGAGMQWRAAATAFLLRAAKPAYGRRRKKAGGGRCGFKSEATLASPVFGQT